MATDNKDEGPGGALATLYDERAYKTFEIFYRFKAANLIAEFQTAIDLYDHDPKLIKFLFTQWMTINRDKLSGRSNDSSTEAYREHEHRNINESFAEEIHSENPEAWQFVKFNDLNTISGNIRKFKDAVFRYALKKGMNQKALSKKLGISSQAMSQFFKSDTMPRPSTLTKIGTALNVDGVYLHHAELESQAE